MTEYGKELRAAIQDFADCQEACQEAFAKAHNACAWELLALIRGKPGPCERCGLESHNGLRGSEAYRVMLRAGCVIEPKCALVGCTHVGCDGSRHAAGPVSANTDTKNNAEWF